MTMGPDTSSLQSGANVGAASEASAGKSGAGVRSVLFICSQNTVRSPMAKVLLDRHSRRRIFCDSVGLSAGFPDPFAQAAVVGDLGRNRDMPAPKAISAADLSAFDCIITLSREAEAHLTRKGVAFEHWDISEPADIDAPREQLMQEYKEIRAQLLARIQARFPEGVGEGEPR